MYTCIHKDTSPMPLTLAVSHMPLGPCVINCGINMYIYAYIYIYMYNYIWGNGLQPKQ